MQAERWVKVDELYQAAMAQPPEKRTEFLSRACPDDAELREEVRSLLAQTAGSFLESGPVSALKTLSAGAKLGHFEIVGLLGRGGMGEVYRARDSRLKRDVAIKVLPAALARDADRIARFEREARAAAGLNHPNIVAIYETGREGDTYWIASELVAGESLAKVMERGPIPVGKAVEIATQIAGGLAAAHAAGIVHRDLKPANLMLARNGLIKILDFGLALQRLTSEDSAALKLTGEGTVVGTAGYMSPEQARGEALDQRSDLFSLGVILFEMLSGKRAFTGGSTVEVMNAILKDDPGALPPSVPEPIASIVGHCLEKSAERRFQSALDLGYALRLVTTTHPQAEGRRKHRRRPLVASVLAALILPAAGSVYWWMRLGPNSEDLHPVSLTPWPGFVSRPTFSPDGNRAAFEWNSEKEDMFHIYVTQIGSGARPVQLTNSAAQDFCPAWSPDDRYIAFLRVAGIGRDPVRGIESVGEHAGTLMLSSPVGGSERKVADFPAGAECPSWTPYSSWLAAPIRDSPQAPYAIWLVSAGTGERRRLTNPPSGQSGDQWPSFSPDRRALVFFREVTGHAYALYLLPLSRDFGPEGELREITKEHYGWGSGTSWTADGRAIVYSAGPFGTSGLFRLLVSGHRAPTRVPYAFRNAFEPAISPSRQRLVYLHASTDEGLWRLDTHTGEHKALVVSSGISELPQYSPDGRKLAFQSSRSGEFGIWTCDADGSNCMQLTAFGNAIGGAPRWSPDSKLIAFDWRVTEHAEIYVIQADGGGQRRLTNDSADDVTPSWSHDGQWIYFASDRTGRLEVWKIPAAGGNAMQVTHNGGGLPVESADGKYLYYVRFPVHGSSLALFRIPARGGPEVQFLPRVANFAFAVGAKAMYFMSDGKSIQRLDLSSGKLSTLATPAKAGYGLSVSPDEAYVVWSQVDHSASELMLVEGFR
jgi:Tol biopolymer transport system component